MQIYITAVTNAIQLLLHGGSRVYQVVALSLMVSGSAVLIAAVFGIPLGYFLGIRRFAGRAIVILLVNTAMGFPPVVVGLFVYLALSRSGPLGSLDLLFTPQGMVIAQVILAIPLVIGVTAVAVQSVARDLRIQLQALGASRIQMAYAILKEARGGVIVSVIAGFAAIISEVGAVSIVGGGIEGYTDVMTTAIMANVTRGDFAAAMAWAMILIGIALSVNIALTALQNTSTAYES